MDRLDKEVFTLRDLTQSFSDAIWKQIIHKFEQIPRGDAPPTIKEGVIPYGMTREWKEGPLRLHERCAHGRRLLVGEADDAAEVGRRRSLADIGEVPIGLIRQTPHSHPKIRITA